RAPPASAAAGETPAGSRARWQSQSPGRARDGSPLSRAGRRLPLRAGRRRDPPPESRRALPPAPEHTGGGSAPPIRSLRAEGTELAGGDGPLRAPGQRGKVEAVA